MSKNKKGLLAVTLIAVLTTAMLTLSACGETKVPQNDAEQNQGEQEPTNSNEGSDEQGLVLQVPMAVANMCDGTTVTELYLSGAGREEWGEDLLAGQTMPTGTQLTLMFNIDKNNVQWDIKAVDENGDAVEFRNLDLSNVSTEGGAITLTVDEAGNPVAVAQ